MFVLFSFSILDICFWFLLEAGLWNIEVLLKKNLKILKNSYFHAFLSQVTVSHKEWVICLSVKSQRFGKASIRQILEHIEWSPCLYHLILFFPKAGLHWLFSLHTHPSPKSKEERGSMAQSLISAHIQRGHIISKGKVTVNFQLLYKGGNLPKKIRKKRLQWALPDSDSELYTYSKILWRCFHLS